MRVSPPLQFVAVALILALGACNSSNPDPTATGDSPQLQLTPTLVPYRWSAYANFWAALPEGWSGRTARVVVTMPGNVLVDQEVPVVDGLASNFDVEAGIADTITVTIYAQDGDAQAAGTIVTHGARVPLAAR